MHLQSLVVAHVILVGADSLVGSAPTYDTIVPPTHTLGFLSPLRCPMVIKAKKKKAKNHSF